MGRSVETISGANVIYFDTSEFDEFDWTDLIWNLQGEVTKKYRSFNQSEKFIPYPYQENRIILENDHVQISISEYCGCGAVSVFVNESTERIELAEHWLAQCFAGIEKIIEQFVSPLRRLGTMSNGVSVFKRKQ